MAEQPKQPVAPATPVAPTKPVTPVEEVKYSLTKLEPQFKAALPPHIPAERFLRVLLTGVQQNPDIIAADRQSLYAAAMRAAQDGLLPDGRESALVVFNKNIGSKDAPKYAKVVQYMPMVAGILKKVRNSGELSSITAHVVRENDKFNYTLGDVETITHEMPVLGADRGKAIGAYAIATLRDGTKIRQIMSLAEIEKRRAASKSKGEGNIWEKWWDEMAEKTVIRRLSARLPMSTDIEQIVHPEDDGDDQDAGDQNPRGPGETPVEPVKQSSSRLASLVGGNTSSTAAVEAEIVASEREELPI